MGNELKVSLERIKNYTLQVAEAMPEKDYDFKPDPSVWSFKELVHHIAYSLIWMDEVYILKAATEWNPPPVPATKIEITDYLAKAFSKVESDLPAIKNDDRMAGFLLLVEHNAHHRGQAVTYLRCKGIIPPEFPF